MVSKIQKKNQKQKTREKAKKKKVLTIRETVRSAAREEKKNFLRAKKIKKIRKTLGDFDQWTEEEYQAVGDDVLDQLQANANILRGLEQEYVNEMARKQELNSQLEDQGLITMEDKIGGMHNDLVMQQQDEIANMGIMPPRDVAEVTVVKAPVEE